uniref:60S ribosomal protein L18a-like protein isoform X2 n=1 Tax=Rhizophora mucronata TaxID=61149 RepID=A0A2P2KG01_RHIMU
MVAKYHISGNTNPSKRENHPIPQPKQGRGLSNIPSWGSSASMMGIYSPFLQSTASFECP